MGVDGAHSNAADGGPVHARNARNVEAWVAAHVDKPHALHPYGSERRLLRPFEQTRTRRSRSLRQHLLHL